MPSANLPSPPTTTTTTSPTKPYKPTHHLPPHNLIDPTPENLERTISVVSGAFQHTPLMIAFFGELNDFTPSTPRSAISRTICHDYYRDGITRIGTCGGVLAEAGDYSAVAVWEPADYAAADFTSGRKRWGPVSREWTAKVKTARIRWLGVKGQNVPLEEVNEFTPVKLRKFWHLGFLARDPDREKVPGAISAVVVPFLDQARREGVPAWLEATSLYGVGLYKHFGFRLVETIHVAKGRYGADGWLVEGGEGEGCFGYCMIYDGHLREGGEE